ncbi:DUF3429 domain-containing protein [Noviherbaspirillum aridicola]|uniref:DUF3429 domain-containing protein n=1 Tax=Noviherbaspirillum aridicola TaxID=2849687 RepID=A0ABQ4Q8W3_9BURK|nr:DUF3429 domain-containing protein [Noviherbaspirillum aridicola]GIZ53507.1 hypothetical protein NCCP691_35210 [Noviherbaspirillum aridicola]
MNAHFLNKRLISLLTVGGVLPFLLLMLACWVVDIEWLGVFIRAQLAWGIAILSFLGGIHWGGALTRDDLDAEQTRKAFTWGILPTLLAWSSTLAGGFGFAVLMAGFVLAYQADKRHFSWYRLPQWFLVLRFRVTAAVIATLALTVIAANVRS